MLFNINKLTFFSTLIVLIYADCIWYDTCGTAYDDFHGTVDLNCKYQGPAKPLDADLITLYKEMCTDLYIQHGAKSCCSKHQLLLFKEQLDIVRDWIIRCPACWRNFRNLFCFMTCSPLQSKNMLVTKEKSVEVTDAATNTTENKTAVEQVDFVLSRAFAYGLHSSCRDVEAAPRSPFMGLTCGATPWSECTAEKWLEYFGSFEDNHRTPVNVRYYITEKTQTIETKLIEPMNMTFDSCEDSCSCTDCTAACPIFTKQIEEANDEEDGCKIRDIPCPYFLFSIGFLVFLLVFAFIKGYNQKQLNNNTTYFARISSYTRSSTVVPGRYKRAGAMIVRGLERGFQKWGRVCVRRPLLVISLPLVVAGIFCCGLVKLEVKTDPVELWSGPNSRGRLEKKYFDKHFGPFYRTEQLIISRPNNYTIVRNNEDGKEEEERTNFSSIFEKNFMLDMLKLQTDIEKITAEMDDGTIVKLSDICFKPLFPDNNNCIILSVFNYFQNNKSTFNKELGDWAKTTYLEHIDRCVGNPYTVIEKEFKESCFGSFGGPIYPSLALGGFTRVKQKPQYTSSTSLIITIVVNNYNDDEKNKRAKAWEEEFLHFMRDYTISYRQARISYRAEISIEKEIERVSESDIPTIIISYAIMFLYSTITLGRYRSIQTVFVDSKIVLGLAGVLVVLLSVVASVGILCYAGIPTTLIIVEVVPFLVLAVGIDNIFILVKTIQNENRLEGEGVDMLIERVLGKIGPSMLLTSTSESLAFFLGAVTDMPAIKWFALYASMALVINFLLQITCFVSFIYLDAVREEQSRVDLLCCVKTKVLGNVKRKAACSQKKYAMVFLKKGCPKIIMHDGVRAAVMIVFVGYFCFNGALTSDVQKGLNQTLAMPTDSYMIDYFNDLSRYLSIGPPLYFVVKDGTSYTSRTSQNEFCGISNCSKKSMAQKITKAAKDPDKTYIAQKASSWIDDYLLWSQSEKCCRMYTNKTFCPSTSKENCTSCDIVEEKSNRPIGKSFTQYLPWFLEDNPNIKCGKGGHASFSSAVELKTEPKLHIGATYFQTYHTVLKKSSDYVKAIEEARKVADEINDDLGGKGEVFPYSVFYVFYEMYIDMWKNAALNIFYCLVAVFITTYILLGLDAHSALFLIITIIMILGDVMGMMYLWEIRMNPISLVNLTMTVGMSVEFCSHIMHAYSCSMKKTRKQRAQAALEKMGGPVFYGIVMTNLIGTVVLAGAQSMLFRVYYFRLYLGTLMFGAAHGLVFLPVLLSYLGPSVNMAKLSEKNYIDDDDDGDDSQVIETVGNASTLKTHTSVIGDLEKTGNQAGSQDKLTGSRRQTASSIRRQTVSKI